VATAADRHLQPRVTGEAQREGDIVGPRAAGDRHRLAVDRAVPDRAGIVVPAFSWSEHRPAEASTKRA
jgi:hypothetical protein